jgi:three-Cys-motif partner protein
MGIDFERLKQKIQPLLQIEEKLIQIHPNVFYKPGPWCVTKLIALAYFVDIYTRIIPRMPFFKKMRYIELLSGAGLCRIDETGDIIAGSALIAATMCNQQFDEYIFIELDEKKAKALKDRMKVITPNALIIQDNCNNVISEIIPTFNDNDHYLAFVDSEGLEVDWSTINTLLSKQGDMIFNFQSQMVNRVVGRANSGSLGDVKRLNQFYGDDRWRNLDGADELLIGYMEKIREETTRKRVVPLPVKGPGSYRYDLILATRKTKGDNPWLKPMEALAETMNGFTPDFIQKALNILTGGQRILDSYFKV